MAAVVLSGAAEKALADSDYIPGLKDDWDGEGNQGYSQVSYDRVVAFVKTHLGSCTSKMSIVPGPEGDIDLTVNSPRTDGYLYVNFPAEQSFRPEVHYRKNKVYFQGHVEDDIVSPVLKVMVESFEDEK